jgi:hypothetical protein
VSDYVARERMPRVMASQKGALGDGCEEAKGIADVQIAVTRQKLVSTAVELHDGPQWDGSIKFIRRPNNPNESN